MTTGTAPLPFAGTPGISAVTRPGRRRDPDVESLRGLAIILMVAGHVIGSTAAVGLRVPDDSAWRWSYLLLEDVRMPLFTLVSGYVYALRRPRTSEEGTSVMRAKVRRVLVPMVFVGAVFVLVQSQVPGVNGEAPSYLREMVQAQTYLWFLQAIFLIFAVVTVMDLTGALRTTGRWITTTGVAAVLFVLVEVPAELAYFSVNGATRLLPFFLVGYGLVRYPHVLTTRVVGVSLAVALGAYAVTVGHHLGAIQLTDMPHRAVRVLVGVGSLLALWQVKRVLRARWLIWLGGYSYAIYLWHVFGSAGSRIVAGRLGLEAHGALFPLGLLAGLLLPVALAWVLRRHRVPRLLFLGEK